MKALIICISIFPLLSFSAEINIIDPCDKEIVIQASKSITKMDLGSFTIHMLNEIGIKYQGDSSSILSINNTPVGSDAIEIIEDNQMKAYGWCYDLNGVAPEVYPNEVQIKNSDKVTWWFGYALYQNGKWITQCTPAYLDPPAFLCQN